jgi:hypothetical protein
MAVRPGVPDGYFTAMWAGHASIDSRFDDLKKARPSLTGLHFKKLGTRHNQREEHAGESRWHTGSSQYTTLIRILLLLGAPSTFISTKALRF